MKNKIIIPIILWALVVGWMGLIFYMSAEPADMSTQTSGGTIKVIFELLYPGFRDMSQAEQAQVIEANQHIVRKLAHLSIYTMLGILTTIAVSYHTKHKIYRRLLPFSIGVIYAISDEIHQLFVPGRSGQISDVLIDTLGVLLGCMLALLISKTISYFHKQLLKNKGYMCII